MRIIVQLLCCSFFATSCGFSDANNSPETAALSSMQQALTSAIQQTPYAALIQNTDAQLEPLPDEDPSDDYAPQRWSITARVLQTYRGPHNDTIRYIVETETGEESGLGNEPFIIVLCQSADGYYWPGLGYNFPGGESEKRLAQEVAQQIDAKQKEFAECSQ